MQFAAHFGSDYTTWGIFLSIYRNAGSPEIILNAEICSSSKTKAVRRKMHVSYAEWI